MIAWFPSKHIQQDYFFQEIEHSFISAPGPCGAIREAEKNRVNQNGLPTNLKEINMWATCEENKRTFFQQKSTTECV